MIAFDQPITATSPAIHQRAVSVLVNRERAKHGVPAVRSSQLLRISARRWALVQTRLSRFGHGRFDRRAGTFPFVLRGGRVRWSVGENLAWGLRRNSTPRRVVRAWMRSPTHRALLLGTWRYGAVISIPDAPLPGRQTSGVTVVQHFGR